LNARYFADGGGAIVVDQSLLGDVPGLATTLLDDPERLADMHEAMLRLARPGAADAVADDLLSLVGSRR
jgi:UDP-N-acetylglucosamine:LPS N-acetylglucosamine transferase